MKRFLAFILLLIYFTVSTGFVVSMHFCMNKFESVQVGAASSDKCGKCGMHTEDSGGCCRDEVKVVKLQMDKQVAKMLLPSLSLSPVELPLSQHLATPFQNFQQAVEPVPTGPPPISSQPVYLSNRVFLI
ncbi:MAG: HYC_CC_PP family protein [Chitinophagaceae bacterium]